MASPNQTLQLSLPDWASSEFKQLPEYIPDLEERMKLVLHFALLNIQHNSGGPFAAGVFEKETGKVISLGVNRVVASNCSSAHAEVIALSLAQQHLDQWDLGGKNQPVYQLVVNWRPCAMCYGATLWSGIRSLAIAGSGPELEQITGFDEGPVPKDWQEELTRRGIEVIDNILNKDAIAVFRTFRDSGQLVYNSRNNNH